MASFGDPPATNARDGGNGAGEPGSRIVVVSNRLPFSFRVSARGISFQRTVGGLVSGVHAYLDAREAHPLADGATNRGDHVWVGWPGGDVDAVVRPRLRAEAMERFRARPVFLRPGEADRFYEGFCNRTLWPLFHYFPSLVSVDEREWATYRAVNEEFRDAVLEVVRPGDAVWVHDYHLMLLPALLRERAPDLPIAFFLHVPFPAYEIFRVLPDPWARALLEGVLGADVVGVHTYDYARHVLRSAQRILGLEHRQGEVALPQRLVRVDAFPMGVDFARYAKSASDPAVAAERAKLRAALGDRKTILSVDRLDYSKGILNRLLAFETFLDRNESWRGRVSLVMVAVPSRTGIDAYRKMKTQIDEAVGRVNGRFGHVGWTPISYQFRGLDFAPLAALYAHCDVALVTPLRDGMNLVAKEYLACRADDTGVLILSDTTGAARELGEAILVNPHHVAGLAEAIREALEMPVEEQRRRNRPARTRLARYDVVRWGAEQFARLDEAREAARRYRARVLPRDARAVEVARYRAATRRLLLLDYDGTLAPFTRDPAAAVPAPRVREVLERLAADPANTVVVVSGRDARTLEAWFDGAPLGLVAEHGAKVREIGGEWSAPSVPSTSWKQRVLPILEVFADRLPGSFVEEKEACVAWHYRGADDELGPVRARELVEALEGVQAADGFHVLRGNKVVEVRPAGATKGDAAARWISRAHPDFVLAAGDDVTDEDLFVALPETALSIRVGLGESHARFNLESPSRLLDLLEELSPAASAQRPADAREVGPAARPPRGQAPPSPPPPPP